MESPANMPPAEPPKGRSREELITTLEGALADWQGSAPEVGDLSPEKQQAILELSREAASTLSELIERLRSESDSKERARG